MSKIAFIGTGIMGKPMASNLQKAGHDLILSDHFNAAPAELVAAGATVCHSPAEAAEQADVIILMVPNTPQVEEVLFGDNGVEQGLTAGGATGKLVIDMSSISPIATKAIAARINEGGASYLDAPVSGGEVGAINAALTIMVGGEQDAFDKARPLFEVMGKNITLVGDNGAGQTCKVANQIIVALNIEAVSEALVFASKREPILLACVRRCWVVLLTLRSWKCMVSVWWKEPLTQDLESRCIRKTLTLH